MSYSYRFRPPLFDPAERGGTPPRYGKTTVDGVVIETDVAVALRDGVTIYADVYRPAGGAVPAVVCASWTGQALHTRGTLEGE